jgi:NAD(P)-dependent dehydrogenase (short-subunit alcohol dehydrogenase family)
MPDRIALVTGASSGIGREAAVELARNGVRVMAVARRADRLAELSAETGVEHAVADLSTEEGCGAAIEETTSRMGPIDILVHAAGVGSAHEREIWLTEPAVWRETMAVNLDASFHLMRMATAGMVERGWGRVVIVSSTAGVLGGPREPAYDASKHGVIGLVRAAALDLAPYAVTCNAVLPGWVRTEMADRSAAAEGKARGLTAAEIWAEREASYAAGRVPTVEELATTIAFLCSDGASGISGETVAVSLGTVW